MTKPELPHYGNGVPAIVVQLKGKHCRKPHGRNVVVDMFRPCDCKPAYTFLKVVADKSVPIAIQAKCCTIMQKVDLLGLNLFFYD